LFFAGTIFKYYRFLVVSNTDMGRNYREPGAFPITITKKVAYKSEFDTVMLTLERTAIVTLSEINFNLNILIF